jgi:thioredoxin-like negative regulator of GroEL
MSDPDDPKIPLLMAKLLMQVGRQEDAHAVLTALPAPASDDPEIAQLRAHLDFIVTASDSPARAEIEAWPARRGLQALFVMLAPDDPRVKRYRAELFNLTH